MPLEAKKKFSELLFRPRRFLKSNCQKKKDSELLSRPRRFLKFKILMVLKEVWAASDKYREEGGGGTPFGGRVVLLPRY